MPSENENNTNPLESALAGLKDEVGASQEVAPQEEQSPEVAPVETENAEVETPSQDTTEVDEDFKEEETESPTDDKSEETSKESPSDEDKEWWEDEANPSAETDENGNEVIAPVDENLQEIGKALGMETFGDKGLVMEEIGKIVQERENYSKEIEALKAQDPFASKEMREANELAKNGGNYKEYLNISSIDYNSFTDTEILAEVWLRPQLGDDEAIENHLNSMSDSEKKLKGNEIRSSLISDQQNQKSALKREANEKKQHIDNGIKEMLKTTTEMYGVKMTPKMRQDTFKSLTSDKGFIKDTFFNKDGSFNFKAMSELAFLRDNIKTIVSTNVSKARGQGVASVFNEASNANLGTNKGGKQQASAKPKSSLGSAMDALRNGEY
jgi:hypothetical protein